MINFAWIDYIPALALVCAAVLLFFGFYMFWRRRVARSLTVNGRPLIAGSRGRILAREILVILAVFFSFAALLKPQFGEYNREVTSEGTDVLIALDVSRSMLARDADPHRLGRAKRGIRWIAESLSGDRIGLLVFAGDSFLLCPFTTDLGAFMMFLDSAGPDSVNIQGTDMGKMLSEAAAVYEKKRLTSKLLVVITDGEDHEGGVEAQVERFRDLGVSVYAAGIGNSKGEFIPAGDDESVPDAFYRDRSGSLVKSSQNEGLLKKLSEGTGGGYCDITDSFSGLNSIIDVIEQQQKESKGTRSVKEKIDRTWIFILLIIVALGAEAIIGEKPRFEK
ncbi:MAG TPA: VWA domain-containing protein [Spirochaetota bacterium]|nr:VWA domain-containing protein [Spirochaetota bacterium]HPJ35397.1 VWA domain-containing protein [Spirochaetota bacterium]